MNIERNALNVSSDATTSGVSWAAVLAGAAAAAALALILLVLGVGLGFSTISPWSNKGLSASAIGASTIMWLILTQIAASGVGGYLAGRLRIKWAAVHNDEVYFRDTAHGLLAWAIASLVAAAMLGTVVGNVVSSTASTAVGVVGAVGTAMEGGRPTTPSPATADRRNDEAETGYIGYTVDSLFRPGPSATAGGTAASANDGSIAATSNGMDNSTRLEVARIFANALRMNSLPDADQQYLAQLVSQRTGLSNADAGKRVSDAFYKAQAMLANAAQVAKQSADNARKAAATSALWMFVALLCGAFFASLAATFGGKQRDNVAFSEPVAY